MKTALLLSVLILVFALPSCQIIKNYFPEPDQYFLNRSHRSGAYIVGENMSDIDSVRQTGDNALLMYGNTTVALASYLSTNFVGDFTVTIQRGNGIKLTFRTTSHSIKTTPGLSFNYTTSGSWMEENGNIIARFDTLQAAIGQPERIQITNIGKQYSIQVGCIVVYRGTTSLPATEYMIPSTISDSKISLVGIDFVPIRRADARNTPEKRAERERW